MNCLCHSKKIYQSDYTNPGELFEVDGIMKPRKRRIDPQIMASTHQHSSIEQKIIETSEIWLPNEIQRISWQQIQFNPFWFAQKFLSKNIPCIITDVLQGDDIFQRWSEPQYLSQALQGQEQSVSLTPDGFADSIRGEYFIEPYQQKMSFKKFIDHEEHFPGAIPYIQHQNNNLGEQFQSINCQVPQETLKHISNHFFKGKDPDAENFWLGFDDSVSSLHKDPYENFYMTIVGEKHFTLMPPQSILHLEEQEYTSARWIYSKDNAGSGAFSCNSNPQSKNRWICQNPQLLQDHEAFPLLKNAIKFHVQLKKEEMLYLPSLWYHQVSQNRGNSPYNLAINYWFDMEFTQNFTLYQTCRSLRGLQN